MIVDDASTNGFGDYAGMLTASYASRVTLIRNETRRGGLYNTWNAVTGFCADPETVIITLDADDALIGDGVLERLRAEYDAGADATVGSMLRLDKESFYPANLANPRRWDSNVWQHLRTFRKRLFDAIAAEDLKLDGQWIDTGYRLGFHGSHRRNGVQAPGTSPTLSTSMNRRPPRTPKAGRKETPSSPAY